MIRHPLFGLVAPELGWVPAPRYLLRRARVLELVRGLVPGDASGRLLEVGCGAGALLDDLAELGFSCDALESSDRALEVARTLHAGRDDVRIHGQPGADWRQRFDLLIALEVLEHIEDDARALARWTRWLRPGGHLLLSVPAHGRKWGPTDVWAGHFRRYERPDLERLIRRIGLQVVCVECYGFPLANLVEPLRSRVHARRLSDSADACREVAASTARSGVERTTEARFFPLQASWPGTRLIALGVRLQRFFLDREWGNGYVALARKPPEGA